MATRLIFRFKIKFLNTEGNVDKANVEINKSKFPAPRN